MEQVTVMFSLPEPTLKALREIADTDGIGIEVVLQNAVKRDVLWRQSKEKAPEDDVHLIALLRMILVDDFAHASGWKDLQRRLRNKGYALHRKDDVLSLCRHPAGTVLCKASDLGDNYERMMRRFWAPFPNYSDTRFPDRMFG